MPSRSTCWPLIDYGVDLTAQASKQRSSELAPWTSKRHLVALGLIIPLLVAGQSTAGAAEGAPAGATSDASNAPDGRRASAKAKYQLGAEAYSNARYADAVRLFLEADAISPSAALSYNIARAYEKLGDDAQTLRWYRNYLRLNPRAGNAAEVEQYIAALSLALGKKGIQQLTVLSDPAGATVAIDGSALGVTPLTVELSPGPHHALLTLRGYSDAMAEISLSKEKAADVAVQLSPAPLEAQAPASLPAEPSTDRGRRFGIAPWITLGAAAACLGGSAIFEVSRRSAQRAATSEQVQVSYDKDFDAMETRQTTARVLLGAGSVLAVAGATLLVFNTRLGPESRASVSGLPGGAAFSWQRSF